MVENGQSEWKMLWSDNKKLKLNAQKRQEKELNYFTERNEVNILTP